MFGNVSNLGSISPATSTTATTVLGGAKKTMSQLPSTTLAVPATTTGISLSLNVSKPTTTVSLIVPLTSTAPVTSTAAQPQQQEDFIPDQSSCLTPFTYSQMNDMLNRWTNEVITEEKIFGEQVNQIKSWDRLVGANIDMLTRMNDMVTNVSTQQKRLNLDLQYMEKQQRDLENTVAALERDVRTQPVSTSPQRNELYQLSTSVDCTIKRLNEDLKEMIQHMNETVKNDMTDDPVQQVGRVLNAHMEALNSVDQRIIQNKEHYEKLSKLYDQLKREFERQSM